MSAAKSIVLIKLGTVVDTGEIDRDAPFLAVSDMPGRSGVYAEEPDVMAQFAPSEGEARFEAEWINGGLTFGRRVADP
jgi:hypothetical protein